MLTESSHSMKTFAKESLRWSVVAICGAYGLWQLICAGRGFIHNWDGGWLEAFVLSVPLFVAVPLLAVAYCCLRRQYRKLYLVLGVVGCVVLFAEFVQLTAGRQAEQVGLSAS